MRGLPEILPLTSKRDRVLGYQESVLSRKKALVQEVAQLTSEEELLSLVCGLFRELIDKEVSEGVDSAVALLTEGLQAVFQDQDLSVRAQTEIQRGKVSLDIITQQKTATGDLLEGGSLDSFGGAVTTVESLLLRILVIVRRGLYPVLFFDESLAAFNSAYIQNFGRFLSLLCDRLGLDVLAVTQDESLFEIADHKYRIRKVADAATFSEVK